MTARTQLAKVEKRLRPQQVVLAYLDEVMRKFKSLGHWAGWAVEHPGEAPLVRAARAAREAVRQYAASRKAGDTQALEEEAVKEATFLVTLLLAVAGELPRRAKEYELEAVLCARSLQLLLLHLAAVQEGTTTPPVGPGNAEQPPEGQAGGRPDALTLHLAGETGSRIRRLLGVLYLHDLTVRAIQDHYFGGHPLHFQQETACLRDLTIMAEALVDEYNGLVNTFGTARGTTGTGDGASLSQDGDRPLLLDSGAVRNEAAKSVRKEMVFMVRTAKAETLIKLGHNQQGADMAVAACRELFGSPED